MSLVSSVPAAIISLEFILGGQCRIGPYLTPSLHRQVMQKAPVAVEALYPIIPVRDPKRHSQAFGALLCLAGGLWAWKGTRGSWYTLGLSEFLSGAILYTLVFPVLLLLLLDFIAAIRSVRPKSGGDIRLCGSG